MTAFLGLRDIVIIRASCVLNVTCAADPTWHAPLRIVVQPPAICQAEGERQEVGLRGELVGNDDATPPQQSLCKRPKNMPLQSCQPLGHGVAPLKTMHRYCCQQEAGPQDEKYV